MTAFSQGYFETIISQTTLTRRYKGKVTSLHWLLSDVIECNLFRCVDSSQNKMLKVHRNIKWRFQNYAKLNVYWSSTMCHDRKTFVLVSNIISHVRKNRRKPVPRGFQVIKKCTTHDTNMSWSYAIGAHCQHSRRFSGSMSAILYWSQI